MPDDQVTIDPQFRPSSPGDGQGRWFRLAGIGAAVVVAFLVGWLMKTPAPNETGPTEAFTTSTQAPVEETTVTTTRSRPSTTTTLAELVRLAVPLGEEVPGFTDTVSMFQWNEDRIEILHWSALRSGPETVVSSDEGAWLLGLDASGRWAAEIADGVLSVDRVPESTADGPWPESFDRAIDVRVASAVWHDSDPGRLAWVQCSLDTYGTDRGQRRTATLHSLDLEPGANEAPVMEATIDGGCVTGWGVSPHLSWWGVDGLRYWSDSEPEGEHLIQPDGTTVAFPIDTQTAVASNGWTAVMDHGYRGESHLVAPDGTTHPVPGLAEGESIGGAVWSPDGARLAYGVFRPEDAPTLIRIVEIASGVVDAEVTAPNHELWPTDWSTDSRFLLLEQWPMEENGNGELMFYDVSLGTSVTVPLPRNVGDIRAFKPAPTADHFAPVEWWTGTDSYSETEMVSMIAEVRPLTPDQVEEVTGRLIWDETVVDLCNISIREVGPGFVHIGDIFGIDEECGANPTAMYDAFNTYGMPRTACLTVTADGVQHEYCSPLDEA